MQIIQQKTKEQLLLVLSQENPEATKSQLETIIDRICTLSLSLVRKFFYNKWNLI